MSCSRPPHRARPAIAQVDHGIGRTAACEEDTQGVNYRLALTMRSGCGPTNQFFTAWRRWSPCAQPIGVELPECCGAGKNETECLAMHAMVEAVSSPHRCRRSPQLAPTSEICLPLRLRDSAPKTFGNRAGTQPLSAVTACHHGARHQHDCGPWRRRPHRCAGTACHSRPSAPPRPSAGRDHFSVSIDIRLRYLRPGTGKTSPRRSSEPDRVPPWRALRLTASTVRGNAGDSC